MQKIPPFDQLGVTPVPNFVNAAPNAGIKGSIVNADFFNQVQGELLSVIGADPNLTPSPTDLTQVLQAIQYLIAQAVASGSVTIPGATEGVKLTPTAGSPGSAAYSLNIPGLTEVDGVTSDDFFVYYDNATGVHRKIPLSAIASALASTGGITAISANSITTLTLAANQSISNNTYATVRVAGTSTFGHVSAGVFTFSKSGWYALNGAGGVQQSTGTPNDTAYFNLLLTGTGTNAGTIANESGGNSYGPPATPSGQTSSYGENLSNGFFGYFASGDTIQLQAYANNPNSTAFNCKVNAGATLQIVLFNS